MNTNAARRHNAKCKSCKRSFSILATSARRADGCHEIVAMPRGAHHARVYFGSSAIVLVDAGSRARASAALVLQPVRGIFRSSIKCDGRCEHATGHDCECACGGKNHGKADRDRHDVAGDPSRGRAAHAPLVGWQDRGRARAPVVGLMKRPDAPRPRRYIVWPRQPTSTHGVVMYDCGPAGDRWEWSFRGRGVWTRFVRLDLILNKSE